MIVNIWGIFMEKMEFEILALFTRYLTWIYDNNIEDTINNYVIYVNTIEKIELTNSICLNIS